MADTEKLFGENADGVHLMNGEFSLCGDAFDAGSSGDNPQGDIIPTKRRVVTCPNCIAVIKMVRGVRIKES